MLRITQVLRRVYDMSSRSARAAAQDPGVIRTADIFVPVRSAPISTESGQRYRSALAASKTLFAKEHCGPTCSSDQVSQDLSGNNRNRNEH